MTAIYKRHNQSGISLLELMLALLVIAAVLFVVIQYFRVARENLRVTQAVEIVNTIAKGGYTWLEGENQADFTNITFQDLTGADLIPSSYKDGTGISPWHSNVGISGSSSLTVAICNVPTNSCYNLALKLNCTTTTNCCTTTGISYCPTAAKNTDNLNVSFPSSGS